MLILRFKTACQFLDLFKMFSSFSFSTSTLLYRKIYSKQPLLVRIPNSQWIRLEWHWLSLVSSKCSRLLVSEIRNFSTRIYKTSSRSLPSFPTHNESTFRHTLRKNSHALNDLFLQLHRSLLGLTYRNDNKFPLSSVGHSCLLSVNQRRVIYNPFELQPPEHHDQQHRSF